MMSNKYIKKEIFKVSINHAESVAAYELLVFQNKNKINGVCLATTFLIKYGDDIIMQKLADDLLRLGFSGKKPKSILDKIIDWLMIGRK